eukprot:c5248_g1_i1.p1 GENE.c5248_g1_i1~~c5248_g1_i1.p1  ORF type:complete len:400 (-),score=73.32 c5248_g1_i1:17-1216(-)
MSRAAHLVEGAMAVEGLPLAYSSWTAPFVIINKPAGLTCQTSDLESDSVETRIINAFNGRRKPFFPHRLDKDTQGLLLLTFNSTLTGRVAGYHAQKKESWLKQYRVLTDIPSNVLNKPLEGPRYQRTLASGPAPVEREEGEKGSEIPVESMAFSDVIQEQSFGELVGRDARTRVGLWRGLKFRSPFVVGQILTEPPPYRISDTVITNIPPNIVKHGVITSWLARVPHFLRSASLPLPSHHWVLQQKQRAKPGRAVPSYPFQKIDTNDVWRASFENLDVNDYQTQFHKSVLHSSVDRDNPRDGRLAITEFNLKSVDYGIGTALFVATLHTGRTHQIRVHFAENGFPVVNDRHYNPHPRRASPTMGLQSFRMRLPNPLRQFETIDVQLPVPPEWEYIVPAK